jgi:hypothetical protein
MWQNIGLVVSANSAQTKDLGVVKGLQTENTVSMYVGTVRHFRKYILIASGMYIDERLR